ncbi:hypothetical protein [Marinomonas sp. THO17]|uniref:hypothetical protein n=1 Tax=Marinomonas sp. THO17 TaxID=3149048 RepID=UPI00336BEF94
MQTTQQMLTGLILSAICQPLLADPITAVIGLNSSQIVEDNKQLSLTPVVGSLLPLTTDFRPLSYQDQSSQNQWFHQIQHQVRVEHKQRELSFTGKLVKVDLGQQQFTLLVDSRPLQLPIDDFYLLPLEQQPLPQNNLEVPVSYQTEQLSWLPQLSLIFHGNKVTLAQQALLQNHANQPLIIDKGLLHYSHHETMPQLKMERTMTLMDSAAPQVTYQDNEASFKLTEQIEIAPYGKLLYPLPSSELPIKHHQHIAQQFTHASQTGSIALDFNNQLSFTLNQDSMPGTYKTFWQRDGLLIPAKVTSFETMREGQEVQVITNKSQTIKGQLTLVSATSKQLPSRQMWRLTVKNLDKKSAEFALTQSTNGVLDIIQGNGIQKVSANSLLIAGKLNPNQEKVINYTLQVNK